MAHAELSHPFPAVTDGRNRLYGGSQKLFARKYVRRSGCGVVACANVLLYMTRHLPGCEGGLFSALPAEGPVPLAAYNRACDTLRRRFLPVIPFLGMNGLSLACGLNLYFRKYCFPYRARWCALGGKRWKRAEAMLRRDIPVILSVGPNISPFRTKHKLNFFTKMPDGTYKAAVRTSAHYVTVTGMDDEYLRVSSWGREYYISRTEYDGYVRSHSASLVSNIAFIKRVYSP